MKLFGVFFYVTAMLAIAACSTKNEQTLALGLRTDLVAGEEFDEIQLVLVRADGERNFGVRQKVDIDGGVFIPGERVTEIDSLPKGSYRLDVDLIDSERQRSVAKRPVLVDVEQNLAVTVPIDRSCLNVACPPVDDPRTEEDESLHIACLGGSV